MSTAYAPGRVNLIGEHTDYTGGYVLPMAVSMGVTCTATPRTDTMVTARSSEMPGDSVQADIAHVQPGDITGWGAYVIGTAWALRAWGVPVPGCDLHLSSTVPAGAGLSSSAAVECAVALAILDLVSHTMTPRDVARVAKKAENEFVGAPTGSMDQVASMLAQRDALLFFDTRDEITRNIPFALIEHRFHLLVIDTHVHHQLVTDEYGERRRALEEATRQLGVASLRDVTDPHTLSELEDELLLRRARHVVTENARVLQTIALLEQGEIAEIGALLNASHASLRDDLEVSCVELDIAVAAALRGGAIGARMVGGGFGGSAIALVADTHADDVKRAVLAAYEERGWRAPDFYDVTPAAGAHLLHSR